MILMLNIDIMKKHRLGGTRRMGFGINGIIREIYFHLFLPAMVGITIELIGLMVAQIVKMLFHIKLYL